MNPITHKVRLVGPPENENKRVYNTFRVPIKVKPGAKIGVKTAVYDMITDILEETFTLTGTQTRFTIQSDDEQVTGDVGEQTEISASALIEALERAANAALNVPDLYQTWADYRFYLNSNRLEARFNSCIPQDPNYDTAWAISNGNFTTLSDTGFTKAAGSELIMTSPTIPRGSHKYSFTLAHNDEFALQLQDAGNEYFTMVLSGRGGTYTFDGTAFPAYAAADDDRIFIEGYGNNVRFRVFDAAGTLQINHTITANISGSNNPQYLLAAPVASVLEVSTGGNDSLTTLEYVRKNYTWDFNPSSRLAKYLGVSTVNRFVDTLLAKNPINGDDNFTGLLMLIKEVKVQGIDGFNGQQDNIIAVIDRDSVEGNNIKYKPNEIDLVSLNLQRETAYTQFTIEIKNTVGDAPLTFGPNAYVELNVYE